MLNLNIARFWVGRALIHAGIRFMPDGRPKRELWAMLLDWGDKVEEEVRRAARLSPENRDEAN